MPDLAHEPSDGPVPADTRERSPRRFRGATLALLGVTALGAGVAGAAIALMLHDDGSSRTAGGGASDAITATTKPATARASTADWASVATRATPGVVELIVSQNVSVPGPPGAPEETREQVVLGSGFVIAADGTIVTNAHVVTDATSIAVRFGDGARATARLVGADPTTDLAVVRTAGAAAHLHPLTLGAPATLKLGAPVLAIGSPFGYAGSVSAGIVSGLGREITSPNGYTLSDAIQTDAAVNHGNSGGPLLDANGSVVAVNAQIADSGVDANVGVAFAIPLDNGNRKVIGELRTTGRVSHAWLGIAGATIDQSVASAAGLKTQSGVLVTGVAASSPADTAGLIAGKRSVTVDTVTICVGGDAIVALNGRAVASMNDLQNRLEELRPGARAALSIVRADGSAATVSVQLGTQPSTPPDIRAGCS